MNSAVLCPISLQSEKEEQFNTLTHLFGFILSIGGLIYLMQVSFATGDIWTITSSFVYSTTLVMLYGASTFYHKCQELKLKRKLKIMDHACIYLLIAGSYTPFTLGPLREFNGWNLMTIEWVIAIIGITLKIIAVEKFQIISLLAYLGMGWLVVFSYETLMNEMSLQAISWLVAGGISYTLGTIFYVWEKLPYNHGIWHLFVLAGSACHYFCVLSLI